MKNNDSTKLPTAKQIKAALKQLADPTIALQSQRFFKTGKGEYGEGDRFIGIRVPVIRQQVKRFNQTPLAEIIELLQSAIHEERLCALLLLVQLFANSNASAQKTIYQAYLANTTYINNWDLVDSSAHFIVGAYLFNKDKKPLYRFAKSEHLWERRIAVLATFYFIKQNQFEDALAIADLLQQDDEDLIHKAVGWMLREVGKRDLVVAKQFLQSRYHTMPRTMLRYAIEKLPKAERMAYLNGSA